MLRLIICSLSFQTEKFCKLCVPGLLIWAVQMEQSMVLGPPTTISDSGVDYSLSLPYPFAIHLIDY